MQIKVSKTFAQFIQKTAKEKGFPYNVELVKFTPNYYNFYVGDAFLAEQYGDFDFTTGKISVIRIEYPDEYYALPRYLSTYELHKEFKARKVNTENELKAMIVDLIEA